MWRKVDVEESMRNLILTAACCALVACGSTAAVKQADRINEAIAKASQNYEGCLKSIESLPGFEIHQSLSGINAYNTSATQRYLTDQEIEVLPKIFDAYDKCAVSYSEELRDFGAPHFAPVNDASISRRKGIRMKLLNKEITIGEMITSSDANNLQSQNEWQQVEQQLLSYLNQSHQAEVRQRQRAASAMGSALQSSGQSMQQQSNSYGNSSGGQSFQDGMTQDCMLRGKGIYMPGGGCSGDQ
jgi:hypothetical protein